ncbi:MAG: hypothetical protein WC515_02580 [Candidatus Omnitrophota bacterium]
MVKIKGLLVHKILREVKHLCTGMIRSFNVRVSIIKTVIHEYRCEKLLGIRTAETSCFKDDMSLCKDTEKY